MTNSENVFEASDNALLSIMYKELLKLSKKKCPGQVAQLVTASSRYAEVMGSIPGPGTYENHQLMHK